MSIRVMTQIWDTCLYEGGTLIVLLAMADWANDDGTKVHPGLETLAAKARMTVRGTQKCLDRLRSDGTINAVSGAKGGRRKVTEYKINLERVNILQGMHEADPKGCNRCQKGCTPQQVKGELQDRKGEQRSAYIDNHQEPSVDPSYAREGSPSASWANLWKAFKTWPGLPAGASEQRARTVWERLRHELPADLEARVIAHGAALVRQNALRGRAGGLLVTHPHNWLERDRGWEAYPDAADAAVAEEDARAAWGGAAGALVDLIGSAKFLAWFRDAQFDSGPPVQIVVTKPFRKSYIEANFAKPLHQAFGDVVLQVAA